MQARVTSVSPSRGRGGTGGRGWGGGTKGRSLGDGLRFAGKDDLGEREEEAEYCFKDFHKLEGFFNF